MEGCDNLDVQKILSRIEYLNNLLEDDTLTDIETANIRAMKDSNIEKIIQEYHHYAICTRKNGLRQTKLPDGRSITAKDQRLLYEKLYNYYLSVIDEPPNISNIFEKWIIDKQKFRSSETISRNKSDWNKYLKDNPIVKKPIQDITPYELLAFYREMVGDGKMTQRCFNNVKSIVNEVYDYAVGNNIVSTNVSKNLSTKTLTFNVGEIREKDYFSAQEKNKLMEYLKTRPKDVYALALIIQFSLGCRIGEIKALTWSDYNVDKKTIFIHKQMVYRRQDDDTKRQVVLNRTKARNRLGNRVLPLSDNAIWALERLREMNLNDTLICVNHLGHPLNTNHYNEHLKKYCMAVGIDSHTSHDTRRYVISASLEAGIPDNIVQQNSGHMNLSTTMGYKRDVEFKAYTDEFLKAVQ